MPEDAITNQDRPRGWKRTKRCLWLGAVLMAVLAFSAAVFLQSSFFREMLRRRIVAAMEGATGGRVELQQISFDLTRLQADLRGIVIHGREGAGEPPLFSAELVQTGWKVLSLWSRDANLRSLRVWNPRIYLSLDENGGSNIPLGVRNRVGNRNWVEQAMALRVGRLEVLRGQMRLQTRSTEKSTEKWFPLEFQAENFLLSLDYEPRADRYSGKLDFQKALLTRSGGTPLLSSVRAKFALYARKAEVESLEWQTAGSHLSAQGSVEDFYSPRLNFRYDMLVDWKEAAEFFGASGWQGKIAWRGQGSYAGQGWQLEGPLSLDAAKTGIASFSAPPWTARGALRLFRPSPAAGDEKSHPWQAEFKGLDVSALGGRFTGGATVDLTLPVPATRLDLVAERISLPALSTALAFPLARLQWAGSISGPLKARFAGAGRSLVVETDWRVDPPPVVPAGFTPVSGSLRGTYQSAPERLESQGSYLNLPHTSLSADGWMDTQDSRMSVTIDTTVVDDVQSLAALFRGQFARPLPVRLGGRARTGFLWTGGTRLSKLNGNLRLTDFDYQGARWDSFAGNFEFRRNAGDSQATRPLASGRGSDSELKIDHGELSRGNAVLEFNGSVGMINDVFAPQSPFSVDASFRNANADDLQALAGTRFPVRGILQGSIRASGARQDPHGQGNLSLTGAEAYGESFERLTAQLTLGADGLLSAQQIRLQKGKGTVQGEVRVGLKTEQVRFSLNGSNLELESFAFLRREHFSAGGLAQAKVSGEGNWRRPSVQAQIEVSQLALAGQRDGKLSIGVDALEGVAHAKWTGSLFRGEFRGSGEIRLQTPFSFSSSSEFENIDLVSVLRTVREPPQEVEGRGGGTVTVEGDLKNARMLRLQGELRTLAASVRSVDFHNAEPLRFRYENGALQLERLHLLAKDTDLEASGSVGLTPDSAMNLKVQGHMDLAALSVLDPDLSSSGQVSLDANLNGTVRKPLWRGRFAFSDAGLRYGSFPNGLTKIKGALIFDGNRASLQDFTAESGGGAVKLGGLITYMPETGLGLQLSSEISGVRVRYPEGVSTWVDGTLTLTGSEKSSMLAGRLVVIKETASQDFDIGAALTSRQQEPLLDSKSAALRNLRLAIQIVSAPNILLETNTAKNLRGDIDLRIQGSLEHPAWLGRISILEGEVTIGGRTYMADLGELTFSNPFRIEPTLDLHVRARVEQYDINLTFTGPLDHLMITYSSDPPLRTSEILSLLVAGSAYGTSATNSSSSSALQLGAGSVLSQALSQQMASPLDRIFGAGHIGVDPQTTGFDRPGNANVALEQHIKDNLTLLYVTNVASAQQQIIQAEVTLSPLFSVAAIRDQNGLIGVNFQIKLRFR